MLFINVKSRLLNKAFWISLISLIVLLSQQFGFDIITIIPKNYTEIVNTIFAILALLGIIVDTSTPGVSDQIVSTATVQAVNTTEETKTEGSTTSINNIITENNQDSSADTLSTSSDKESDTSSNTQDTSNITLDAATQAAVLAAAQAAIQANNLAAQA